MKKLILLFVAAMVSMAVTVSAQNQRAYFDLKGPVKSATFDFDSQITIHFYESGKINKSKTEADDENLTSVELSNGSGYVGGNHFRLMVKNGKLSSFYYDSMMGSEDEYVIKKRNATTGFTSVIISVH